MYFRWNRSTASDHYRSYFRERCTEIHWSQDNFPFRRYSFSGSGIAGNRSRRTDRRKSDRRAWRKSISICSDFCSIYSLCRTDKLYVKHSDNRSYGSNLSVHRTGNGSWPESSTDGMCNRRFLCLRNTDRNAGKYDGSRSRRIQIYGLCKSRFSAYHHSNYCKYDHSSDRIPVLPVRSSGMKGIWYNKNKLSLISIIWTRRTKKWVRKNR